MANRTPTYAIANHLIFASFAYGRHEEGRNWERERGRGGGRGGDERGEERERLHIWLKSSNMECCRMRAWQTIVALKCDRIYAQKFIKNACRKLYSPPDSNNDLRYSNRTHELGHTHSHAHKRIKQCEATENRRKLTIANNINGEQRRRQPRQRCMAMRCGKWSVERKIKVNY